MMRLWMVVTAFSGLLLVTACSNPAADKSTAFTGEAKSATPQSTAQGEKYSITSKNSKIEFVASKVTGSHNGSFIALSGVIDFAVQPKKSLVTVNINLSTVSTDKSKSTK